MATPKHQQIATPKNHLTTPNKPSTTSSPRPTPGAFSYKTLTGTSQLAGKSPAIKTPASHPGHGHIHRISVSSAPSGTPLAMTTLPDDLLNINTPVTNALMGIGQTGLTPLQTTQDGLDIGNGSLMSGMGSLGNTNAKGAVARPRDLQAERHTHLQQVADILRKKAAGRGVNRKSLQTLAKIHKYNIQYEEADNFLNIAGNNIVDLGITFGKSRTDQENVVEAVTLELIGSDGDGVKQPEKAEILHKNLTDTKGLPWIDLSDFSANLGYLARFEELGIKSNAFKAVDNLYDAFQKIWSEERKRTKWRNDAQHTCESNVGMPSRDQHGRLGVQTKYWTDGRRDQRRAEVEAASIKSEDDKDWSLSFVVEKGITGVSSIPSNQEFLADEVLVNIATSENVFRGTIDKPAWQSNNIDGLDLALEATSSATDAPQIQYAATLDPPVRLTAQAITLLNQIHPMVTVDPSTVQTLRSTINLNSDVGSLPGHRWTRPQTIIDRDDMVKDLTHSYALYSSDSRDIFCYSVEKLTFPHPKHLADALPVLRQYALVDALLQSLSQPKHNAPQPESTTVPRPPSPPPQQQTIIVDRTKIRKRSNKPKAAVELDELMKASEPAMSAQNQSTPLPLPASSVRNIDVTVSLLTPPPSTTTIVRLELLISSPVTAGFTSLGIEVRPNGIVAADGLDDTGATGLSSAQRDKLLKTLARVVRVSEDLGVMVEWLLRELEGLKQTDGRMYR